MRNKKKIMKTIRKKYCIQEGDIIKIRKDVREDAAVEKTTTKIVRAKIVGIYPNIIALQYAWGTVECFDWWEFEQRRT